MTTNDKNGNDKVQRSVIEATVTPAGGGDMTNGGLCLSFLNGEKLQLQLSDLAPDIIEMACLHGLKQKLVDAAAISRDPATGRAATVETKFAAVKEVFDRLLSGQWNKAREGGAGAGGLLFKALMRMYDGRKTEEDVRAWLDGKTDAEKTALRKNPRVAEIIEQIRAETGKTTGTDTDALLAELED